MLPLSLGLQGKPSKRVLALGSHSDDIEIGCGGTLLRLIEMYPDLEVCWVVLSATGVRAREATASAQTFLEKVYTSRVVIREYRDSFFPYHGAEIKEYFGELKREFDPDVVFTHARDDLHQDHRLVCQLTANTFRDHLVLEYEVPKYDGDLGAPNFFVHLDEATCGRKVEALLHHFGTQRGKHWFTADLFFALLRIRGMESNSPSRYAEAFYCRKAVL